MGKRCIVCGKPIRDVAYIHSNKQYSVFVCGDCERRKEARANKKSGGNGK